MKKLLILSTLPLALLLFPADSFASVLTFDEFGTSSLLNTDTLSVSGVTFHFSSGTSYYDGQIEVPMFVVLVTDPLLTGPTTGMLTMDFASPTSLLSFDLVLNSMDTIDPAYTVVLSDGSVIVGSTTPQPGGLFSEGTFLYTGAPITGAAVTFFNGADLNRRECYGLWVGQSGVRRARAFHAVAARGRASGLGRDQEA